MDISSVLNRFGVLATNAWQLWTTPRKTCAHYLHIRGKYSRCYLDRDTSLDDTSIFGDLTNGHHIVHDYKKYLEGPLTC